VCALKTSGRTLLASASDDRTVRLWDPDDARELRRFEGHTDCVTAVCALKTGGRTLLASASDDRTVRVWDPTTGRQWETIALRHTATALTAVGPIIFVGATSGAIALELSIEFQQTPSIPSTHNPEPERCEGSR
jgi:WD40 repeat protein